MKYVLQRHATFRLLTAILLTMGMSSSLFAQEGSVSGNVTEAKTGEVLPGVNVVIEGINLGASTDLDGNFTIANVPVGSYTITALFIGFTSSSKSVEVTDGGTATVDFRLESSILGLDELVVTATGVRRRVEIGNSIARIDAAEDVEARPISSISDLLQGQATGVQILESGGSTGMGSRIRIRGSNSASLSNEPVIYVDGILINNQPNSISFETGGQSPSRLNDINPEDIESIEIIKGPSATTLYGSVAANGVIRITTKRGRVGRPRWSVFTETGLVNDIGDYPANFQTLDAAGNPCFTFEASEGICTQGTVNSFQPLTDSRTSPFRTGQSYGFGLSVSGGTEALTYYFSGNYSDSEGVLPINNITRAGFRGNFGSQVTDNLKVNLSTGYLSSDKFTFEASEGICTQGTVNSFQPLTDSRTSPFRTGQSYGFGLSVSGGTEALTYYFSGNYSDSEGVLPINNITRAGFRGNFGSQVTDNLRVNLSTGYLSSDLELPLNDNYALGLMGQGLNGAAVINANDGWGEFTPAELFTIETRQSIDRFTTGLEAIWGLSENLNFRVSGGLDFTSRWDNQFFPTGEAPAFLNFDQGARFSNRFNDYVYTLDAVGSYKKSLSESITSRTAVGFQYLRNLTEGTLSTGLQLVAGSSSIAGAATTTSVEQTIEQRTVGIFVEEQVIIRDRLFVTGAIRSDRGSAFGAALNAVVYPKLSVSWLVSDESFFNKGSKWISSLRLRGAWGESGVQQCSRNKSIAK